MNPEHQPEKVYVKGKYFVLDRSAAGFWQVCEETAHGWKVLKMYNIRAEAEKEVDRLFCQ